MNKFTKIIFGGKCPKIIMVETIIMLVLFGFFIGLIGYFPCLLESRINAINKLGDYSCYITNIPYKPNFVNEVEAKEAYNAIVSSDSTQYTMYNYAYQIYDNGDEIAPAYANEGFFQAYDLRVIDGRMFVQEDFNHKMGEVVPILVGYDVKERYELGKTYDFFSPGTAKPFKGEVIGILEENSNYVSHLLFKVQLDEVYIMPISGEIAANYFGYSDYDMALNKTAIVPNNSQSISDLRDKVVELTDLSIEFIDFDDFISDKRASFLSTFFHRLLMGLAVMLIIFLIIFIQMKLIIRKQNKQRV